MVLRLVWSGRLSEQPSRTTSPKILQRLQVCPPSVLKSRISCRPLRAAPLRWTCASIPTHLAARQGHWMWQKTCSARQATRARHSIGGCSRGTQRTSRGRRSHRLQLRQPLRRLSLRRVWLMCLPGLMRPSWPRLRPSYSGTSVSTVIYHLIPRRLPPLRQMFLKGRQGRLRASFGEQ